MALGKPLWRAALPYSLIRLAAFLVAAMPPGMPGKALALNVDTEKPHAQKVDDEEPPTIPDEKGGPPNLESVVIQLIVSYREHGVIAADDFAGDHGIEMVRQSVVLVVETDPGRTARTKNRVRELGGAVLRAQDRHIKIAIPIPAIERLVDDRDVIFARLPHRGYPSAESQGVEVTGADIWHSAGFTGQGVKVAIVDLGFEGYSSLLGTELPDTVVTRSFRSDGEIGAGITHGINVAEIVHDMAPDASLYLVNFDDSLALSEAVDWLKSQDVDVINHSISWFNAGPGDGTGPINSIVTSADNGGILWVNSAVTTPKDTGKAPSLIPMAAAATITPPRTRVTPSLESPDRL